jgi:hypothetical protein
MYWPDANINKIINHLLQYLDRDLWDFLYSKPSAVSILLPFTLKHYPLIAPCRDMEWVEYLRLIGFTGDLPMVEDAEILETPCGPYLIVYFFRDAFKIQLCKWAQHSGALESVAMPRISFISRSSCPDQGHYLENSISFISKVIDGQGPLTVPSGLPPLLVLSSRQPTRQLALHHSHARYSYGGLWSIILRLDLATCMQHQWSDEELLRQRLIAYLFQRRLMWSIDNGWPWDDQTLT